MKSPLALGERVRVEKIQAALKRYEGERDRWWRQVRAHEDITDDANTNNFYAAMELIATPAETLLDVCLKLDIGDELELLWVTGARTSAGPSRISTKTFGGWPPMCEVGAPSEFLKTLAHYWHARARVAEVEIDPANTDEMMDKAMFALQDATLAVLDCRLDGPAQLLEKVEIIEHLMMQERVAGRSAVNYPMRAISALKRDLIDENGRKLHL